MVRLLVFLLFALAAPAAAVAEVRALVVASSYAESTNPALRLANTLVDGRNVAEALRRAGVHDVRLIEEPDLARWDAEIAAFADRLGPTDIALLYYAGHAIQVSGRNYFLTGDGISLIDMERMIPRFSAQGRGAVLIVDACRNNPFQRGSGVDALAVEAARNLSTVSVEDLAAAHRGLSQLGDLRGMSILAYFSTEPGNVAEDGEPGAGSPFANAFAMEVRRRQSLDSALRRITQRVNRVTEGRQSPWRQGDLPFDIFLAGMQNFPVP